MKKIFLVLLAIPIGAVIFAMASKNDEDTTAAQRSNPQNIRHREMPNNMASDQRDRPQGERPLRDRDDEQRQGERPQRDMQANTQRQGERPQRDREQPTKKAPSEETISHRKAIMEAIEAYKQNPTPENKAAVIEKLEERYNKEVEMQLARVETLKAEITKLEEKAKEIADNKDQFIEDQFNRIIEGKGPKSHEDRGSRK